jgi:hypothetical protein
LKRQQLLKKNRAKAPSLMGAWGVLKAAARRKARAGETDGQVKIREAVTAKIPFGPLQRRQNGQHLSALTKWDFTSGIRPGR